MKNKGIDQNKNACYYCYSLRTCEEKNMSNNDKNEDMANIDAQLDWEKKELEKGRQESHAMLDADQKLVAAEFDKQLKMLDKQYRDTIKTIPPQAQGPVKESFDKMRNDLLKARAKALKSYQDGHKEVDEETEKGLAESEAEAKKEKKWTEEYYEDSE
jgi:hypothetical protein